MASRKLPWINSKEKTMSIPLLNFDLRRGICTNFCICLVKRQSDILLYIYIYLFRAARKLLEEMNAMKEQMPKETEREMQGKTAITFRSIMNIHNVALLK